MMFHGLGSSPPELQVFLTSWPGREEMARNTELQLRKICKPVVINSGEFNDGWVNVGDLYYGGQFAEIMRRCGDGGALLIQGDATLDDWNVVIQRYRLAWRLFDFGVYAPNQTRSDWDSRFDRYDYGHGFRETWNTDCTAWILSPAVIKIIKSLDIPEHKYGWGFDGVACAVSRWLGKPVVKDYGVTVHHHGSTGYNKREAHKEQKKMVNDLPPHIRELFYSA